VTAPTVRTVLALEADGLCKSFAGTPALRDATLSVRPGTVHALLGGNGSGKSTLLKVLAGVHVADAGEVAVHGSRWPAAAMTARRAREAGLRFVHQDLGLFDSLTVAENVGLAAGFPVGAGGGVRWRELNRYVAGLLEHFEIDARPTTPVGELRPAQRTMVAIARALQDRGQQGGDQQGGDQQGGDRQDPAAGSVLLLDEPTASLPDHESRLLMTSLRRRADLGQTVVLVSHHMQEVLSVADDITVLRDGRVAGSVVGRTPSEAELVELIAGRSVDRSRHSGRPAGDVVLDVQQLSAGPLRDLTLQVRRGEVVGLAGLVGSGRTTALSALFGGRRPTAGTLLLGGAPYRPRGARDAMRRGVALVPEDRLADAAFADMSVSDNCSATVLSRYFRGWLRAGEQRRDAQALLRQYDVKAPGTAAPLSALSGGNQQKVVLARWLRRDPSLLLLDEPTQGVDVVARSDIYRTIRTAASGGCAVLVASSDFEELTLLCDRVLVLRGGRVVADLPADDVTADRLTHLVQAADSNEEVLP
jgi:ribose transport system ATP-binding protein